MGLDTVITLLVTPLAHLIKSSKGYEARVRMYWRIIRIFRSIMAVEVPDFAFPAKLVPDLAAHDLRTTV